MYEIKNDKLENPPFYFPISLNICSNIGFCWLVGKLQFTNDFHNNSQEIIQWLGDFLAIYDEIGDNSGICPMEQANEDGQILMINGLIW